MLDYLSLIVCVVAVVFAHLRGYHRGELPPALRPPLLPPGYGELVAVMVISGVWAVILAVIFLR